MFTGGRPGDTRLSPTSVAIPDSSPVKQVGSSNSSEYALLANGTLWAWGLGTHGELGDGGDSSSFSIAVQVRFPDGVSIASIPTNSMPFNTGMAVDTSGHAWGWGLNAGGPLCLGNTRSSNVPVELPFQDVTALAGAANHAVYDADGVLYSCGQNGIGVLGAGPHAPGDATRPVQVENLSGDDVTALVSSQQNAGALLSDGRYYDWGFSKEGQLGNGSTSPSSVPVEVHLPAAVTQVAQGGSKPNNGQTLVSLSDGSLYGWGDNSYDQIAEGLPSALRTPRRVSSLAFGALKLASGGSTSYAITTGGDLYAWGQNNHGQVGNGSTVRVVKQPVLIATSVSAVSATAKNAVAGCSSD
jgi:alpha-tubulin suppressor-like RCC1 family protein